MAKRRLNQQQKRRISQRQAKHTHADNADLHRGLVLSHHGREVAIEYRGEDGQTHHKRCHFRANLGQIVAGDRVTWRENTDDNSGVVEAIEPRETLLERPDKRGRLKPVAANIDQVILVIAVEPEPHDNLIDRYLVAAELNGLTPVILLNKADLITNDNRNRFEALLQRYSDLGYETDRCSQNDASAETLARHLERHTSIVAGQSGVGKSSLINRLLGAESIRTGDISSSTGKGTHTTTTARLYHLPGGGDLIDSPGIREFALGHLELDDLVWGFRELRDLPARCRFRDCRHSREPGCAVREALEDGPVSPDRAHSFERIRHEIETTS